MSNQFLKLRRSAVPGRVPSTSSIDFGEIALNTFDGLAFIKRSGSLGEEVITLGSREGAFTGSFSGSFVGNGAGLFNVPASGIVGLNLSQIATGSVSASVGIGAASFNVVSASNSLLYVSSSGNVGIGTSTPAKKLSILGEGEATVLRGQTVYFREGTDLNFYIKYDGGDFLTYRSYSLHRWQTFNTAYDTRMQLYSTGNLVLQNGGTFTDSGDRLQVSGSSRFIGNMVITGSGIPLNIINESGFDAAILKSQYTTAIYIGNDNTWGWFGTAAGGGGSRVSVATQGVRVNVNGTEYARFGQTGNLILQNGGVFTDSGERLQVSGSSRFIGNMVITGSGNNSATNALTVQNSDGVNTFLVRNDGLVNVSKVGTTATFKVGDLEITNTTNSTTFNPNTRGVTFAMPFLNGGFGYSFTNSTGISDTANTFNHVSITAQLIPSSGNATYTSLRLAPTINQTGTANGISRGLYVNPTLTLAADFRAIEWSNNASGSAIWGLYGSGSAPNYLSGSLNIGTTTLGPNILNVNGTTSLNGNTTITGSLTVTNTITAQTLVVQTITSSTDYVSGSTIFGNSLSNTHQFTGSVSITGSLSLPYLTNGSVLFVSGGSISQNNSNFFWNNATNRLGINTSTPNSALQVVGTIRATNIGSPLFFSEGSDDLLLGTQGGTVGFTIKATTRNLMLYSGGLPADGGQRLQVYGTTFLSGSVTGSDMLIRGSGNTSGTNALIVQNSNSINALIVRNDQTIFINDNKSYGSSTDSLVLTYPNVTNWIGDADKGIVRVTSNGRIIITDRYSSTNFGAGLHVNRLYTSVNIAAGLYSGITTAGVVGTNALATTPIAFPSMTAIGTAGGSFNQNNTITTGIMGVGRYQTDNYGPAADAQTYGGYFFSGTSATLNAGSTKRYIGIASVVSPSLINDTSSIGIGLSVSVEGTYTRYAALFTGGSVGIGTTTPISTLDVRGNTFISGTLDILDAEINYQRNNNVTTGSARLIASIPTASLNAAFFDYVIVSGSNARAGTVTSVWASSSVEWNETYTNDIGSTTDVSLYAAITGSSIGLFATSSINNIWTIKSLIRTI